MNKKEKTEQEIQKTLELLDHMEQLPPDHSFYTRVMARLDEERQRQSVFPAILKPAFLTALIVINLGTAIRHFRGSEATRQTDSQQELIEVLSRDLNLEAYQSNLFTIE